MSFSSIFVSSNGFMYLGQSYYWRRSLFLPPLSSGFRSGRAIAAPFWDNFHPSTSNLGRVYYNIYFNLNQNLHPIVSEVKRRIEVKFNVTDFNPLIVFKATWSEVVMSPEDQPGFRNLPSTFQAIIASDGCETYLLYIYKEDGMLWQPGRRAFDKALIGYTDGAQLEHIEASGEYKPDQRVQSQDGVDKGQYFYKVTSILSRRLQARCECVKWYLKDRLTPWVVPNLPCPCSSFQANSDPAFAKSVDNVLLEDTMLSVDEWRLDYVPIENCYQRVNGLGPRCCYYSGRIQDTRPFGGRFVRVGPLSRGQRGSRYERFQIPLRMNDTIASRDAAILQRQYDAALEGDLIPRRQCCRESRSYRYYRLYRERRPTATCRRYRSKTPSFLRGDPHLTTLDGNDYTFNGLGEFDLIFAQGKFRLQGRTARVKKEDGTESDATGFVAFAVQDYTMTSGKVIFKLNESDPTGKGVLVTIDGNPQAAMTDQDPAINGIKVTKAGESYRATFPSEQAVSVSASNAILTVQFTGSADVLQNFTKGLLGHWTGNKEDDFELRNGTVLDYQSLLVTENVDILSGAFYERKLYPFGFSWQVTEQDSLFMYTTGSDTYASYNPSNPPEPPFLEELVANQRGTQLFDDTVAGCTSEGTLSTPCLYDTLSTNRTELGQDTQQSGIAARSSTVLNNNNPPELNITNSLDFVDGFFQIKLLENAQLQLEATDADGDNITFGLAINNTVPVMISETGLVTWIANTALDTAGAQLIVSASDGIEESLLMIAVLFCPCLNDGACLYDETTTGDDLFQIVSCNCTEAWFGDVCDLDRDGCDSDPCYPNVTCTDVTAPGVGETCGQCPAGTSGDGRKCVTINLCQTAANCSQGCTPFFNAFLCFCYDGFRANAADDSICDDINECMDSSPCDTIPSSECNNTIGSFICECPEGTTSGDSSCDDINECAEDDLNDCDPISTSCRNVYGTYNCDCKTGYERPDTDSPRNPCTDINECGESDDCDDDFEDCSNTAGSFVCDCKIGFEKHPLTGNCENVNECADNPCPTNLTCFDNIGSFNCSEGEPPPLIECRASPIISLTTEKLNELDVGFNDGVVVSPKRLDNLNDVDAKCFQNFGPLVRFELDLEDCSPIIEEDDYFIYVTYVIRNQPYRNPNSVISVFKDYCFNATCKFQKKSNISMGSSITPIIKKTEVGEVVEKTNFKLEMCFYKDYDFEEKLPKDNLKVFVYDDVFIKIALPEFEKCDEDFILQIKKCFATPYRDTYEPKYELISDSCPANGYVTVKDNYEPLCGSFKFKSFVWTNVADDDQKIIVSCDVTICYKDNDTWCERDHVCDNSGSRRRRDLPNRTKHMRLISNPLTVLKIKNNLCAVNKGGCSDECWMDNDKVKCLCLSGRTLGNDGKTCYDQLKHNLAEEAQVSEEVIQAQRIVILVLMGFVLIMTCLVMYKRNRS